jgi:regulatory protein
MIIVSLKTEASGELFRIGLSDGSLFSFRNCYLPPELQNAHLVDPASAEGKEITAAEEAAFRSASACLRAEKAALRLIARAEQCTSGLSRKLEKRGHERTCVNAVISRLSALRLLNDSRYAGLWIESRLRLARSPRRLLISLCARGIDRDDAQAALKKVLDEETELSMIARFAKKHAKKAGGRGEDIARSLKHVLKSEGFSHAAILRFFDKAAY